MDSQVLSFLSTHDSRSAVETVNDFHRSLGELVTRSVKSSVVGDSVKLVVPPQSLVLSHNLVDGRSQLRLERVPDVYPEDDFECCSKDSAQDDQPTPRDVRFVIHGVASFLDGERVAFEFTSYRRTLVEALEHVEAVLECSGVDVGQVEVYDV